MYVITKTRIPSEPTLYYSSNKQGHEAFKPWGAPGWFIYDWSRHSEAVEFREMLQQPQCLGPLSMNALADRGTPCTVAFVTEELPCMSCGKQPATGDSDGEQREYCGSCIAEQRMDEAERMYESRLYDYVTPAEQREQMARVQRELK